MKTTMMGFNILADTVAKTKKTIKPKTSKKKSLLVPSAEIMVSYLRN